MLDVKKILPVALALLTAVSPVLAASPDDELSIMAAEQRKEKASDVEPEPPIVEPEPVRPQKPVAQPTQPSTPPTAPVERPSVQPSGAQPSSTQPSTPQSTVGTPNPIVSFGTFEEAAEKLGYAPLYVPKSSGYSLNYIAILNGTVAELRYGRRWETEVNLVVRTYKRPVGEELRDISGVHGVKWRVDLSGGIPIYLARINESSNAAAWSVGQYTFAAMTENLSFAAFRTLVFEELSDLSSHYFLEL